jgi:hypothetical protein
MSGLPLPIRIAAGLAATAVERARKLPEQLAGLPVSAVSRTLQASMRLQQQITELAIKGDEALSWLAPVRDEQPWATFDEDGGAGPDLAVGDRAGTPAEAPEDVPSYNGSHAGTDTAELIADITATISEMEAAAADIRGGRLDGELTDASGDDDDSDGDDDGDDSDDDDAGRNGRVRSPEPVPRPSAPRHPARPAVTRTTDTDTDTAPAGVANYDELTLAQLRGRLRALNMRQLQQLLRYEQAHADRAPFVTMLSNRIITVRNK